MFHYRIQHALSVPKPVVGAQVVMCEDLRLFLRAGQRQEPVPVPRWIRSGFAPLGVPQVWWYYTRRTEQSYQ